MKKSIFSVLIIFISIIFSVNATFACSCIEPKSPLESAKDTDVIFIGIVENIKTHKKDMLDFSYKVNNVTFNSLNNIKGIEEKNIKITTAKDSATCGYNFEEGKTYIVYANYNNEEDLSVSLCSRTALVEHAIEDLDAFNTNNEEIKSNSGTFNPEKIDGKNKMNINYMNKYIIFSLILLGIILMVFGYKLIKKDQ